MRCLLFLLLPVFPACLPAQEALFERLATEVCNCMERVSVETTRKQATNCLREVALANDADLLRQYRLEAGNGEHRELLAERLADALTENCPILATFRTDEEVDHRWSDANRPAPVRLAYTSPKGPPADPPESVTSESPPVWRAVGIVERSRSNVLVLRLPDESTMQFEFAPEFSRHPRVAPGRQLTVTYRREWRKGDYRIVNLITGVE